MQDRIKELAEAAGMAQVGSDLFYACHSDIEQLARAMALECIAELQSMYTQDDLRDGEESAKTLSIAEDKIRARFGVAKE